MHRRAVLSALALGLVLISQLAAQDDKAAATPTLISITSYKHQGVVHILRLWRWRAPRPPRAVLLKSPKGIWTGPDGKGYPTEVFYLEDAPTAGAAKSRIVWIWYARYSTVLQPMPHFSGDVVWHPLESRPYVVFSVSNGLEATLRLFPVNPKKEAAPSPLKLPTQQDHSWPRASESSALLQMKQRGRQASAIARTYALPTVAGLLVHAQLVEPRAQHMYFKVDLAKNEWREVVPRPVAQTD